MSSSVFDSRLLRSERLEPTVFLKNLISADVRDVIMKYGIWDGMSMEMLAVTDTSREAQQAFPPSSVSYTSPLNTSLVPSTDV